MITESSIRWRNLVVWKTLTMSNFPNRQEVVSLVLRFSLSAALSYLSWRMIREIIEPNRKERLAAEKRTKELLHRLGLPEKMKLSEHEVFIATNLVEPSTLPTDWSDIGGLDTTIEELRRTVLMPLRRRRDTKMSSLVQPPKGILLFGPPGCGKTMLAKALAKEADARFINLQLSTLTDKWYGESQKLAAAVFSLAEKIQPALIFIDEIDAFLRVRDRGDHEVTAMMKAQFLSLWDGLTSDSNCRIVVIGATNRPQDVDEAIKRRLPCTFLIGLPLSDDVDLGMLAARTPSYSGADLQELCRKAAVRCYNRCHANFHAQLENEQLDFQEEVPRAPCERETFDDSDYTITMDDFLYALQTSSSTTVMNIGHHLSSLSGHTFVPPD